MVKRTLQLPRGQSIRTRLLVLLLGLTIISGMAAAYLGVNSVQNVGATAQNISANALRTQAEEFLRQVTVGDAQRNDLILQRAQRDASNMAQVAAAAFENPAAFTTGAYWSPQERMFVAEGGQYMNGEADLTSAFVPNYIPVTAGVLRDLEVGAYLELVLAPTMDSDPNTVAIYLATEQETTRYYPNISLGAVVPPDFTVTGRPWYLSAAPASNPDRLAVWSPIYPDATGRGFLVTAAAPVYANQSDFVGVVGIDVTLADLGASVEETRLAGGYSFLIDEQGNAIAMPAQGYLDILGRPQEPEEIGPALTDTATGFGPVLGEMLAGETGFAALQTSGRELFVAYAPLEATGWSLGNVVDADTILQAVTTLETEIGSTTRFLLLARILPIGAIILFVMVIVGLFFANRLTRPIQSLATAVQQIGAGDWSTPLPPARNDEIGMLTMTFGSMANQLRQTLEGLEQQVADRTYELQSAAASLQSQTNELEQAVGQSKRRSNLLQASAEVSRAIAQIRQLDPLLSQVTHLISQHFGFYHSGIFLVDETGLNAMLRATNSEGGQRMLARGHRLGVGTTGIVGFVTGSGRPRVALNVGTDASFFNNPDLPETRSEMAVPLRIGGQVIGALDVQSTDEGAFDQEDVGVLTALADQIAIAIENTRLLEQTQIALREAEAAQRRYVRHEWDTYLSRRPAAVTNRPPGGNDDF